MDTEQPKQGLLRTQPTRVLGTHGSEAGEFNNPHGVAFDARRKTIAVADQGNHRVQVFSQKGEFVCEFSSDGKKGSKFQYPRGIAFQPSFNQLLVAEEHCVQVFAIDSSSSSFSSSSPSSSALPSWSNIQHMFSVGRSSQGDQPGQFYNARGLTCTPQGHIIVTDCNNNRVQIFDVKGKLVRCFGANGAGGGHFALPFDVQVDARNSRRIMVADCYNNRVSLWSSDGSHPIGDVPVGEYPRGICMIPNTAYVVVGRYGTGDMAVYESNAHKNWPLIQQFGARGRQPGNFTDPCGICVDDCGVLIVADWGNDRMQWFER